MKNLLSDHICRENGLTLIEIIVALAIFTIVAFVMSSALISVVGESQRSRASQQAVNNLNVAMSQMVNNLRTGFYHTCTEFSLAITPTNPYEISDRYNGNNVNCPDGNEAIAFVDQNNEIIIYTTYLSRISRLVFRPGPRSIGLTFLTPPSIEVDDLTFRVIGAARGDNEQTKVLMTVSGVAGDNNATSSFSIQTSATQRLLYP